MDVPSPISNVDTDSVTESDSIGWPDYDDVDDSDADMGMPFEPTDYGDQPLEPQPAPETPLNQMRSYWDRRRMRHEAVERIQMELEDPRALERQCEARERARLERNDQNIA